MDIFVTILLIPVIIISSLPFIYWWLMRDYNYWRKRGVKGPQPLPIVGTNLASLRIPMVILETEWYQKYGQIYGVYNKTQPMLTIGDPELIKSVLVKDFHVFTDRKLRFTSHQVLDKHLFVSRGEDWKRLRSIISPTFTSGKMRKMFPMIKECLNEFIEHLEVYAKDRKNINLKDMHGNFTMDVISTCAFATKTNAHKDLNNPFILNAKRALSPSMAKIIAITLLPRPVLNLLNIKSTTDQTTNEFFINTTRRVLRQRKSEPIKDTKYCDFIQLLANAETDRNVIPDLNDKDESHHVNEGEEELNIQKKTFSINVVNKQLTEEEITAQGFLFFLAGYETTSTTLTFCSYELALHPEVQEKLYEEVQQEVDSNGDISYEKLAKLPYLDSVLSETLRLYPPVLRLERKCMTDYKLGDTGIQLYNGQDIEIPVYAIHHSEEYYPNPNQFNPDRFMPENRQNIVPYTYLPFGAGPRNCIGMRFALMEMKLGLAQIIRRFRFFRSSETAVPLEFKPNSRINAAKSVVVGIENRV